jgi:hypothetical protein
MASYGTRRDEVFSLIMCYADYSWDKCMSCVDAAVAWVGAGCPYSRSASVNYDRCLLRHSNEPFFGAADELNLTSWVVCSLEDAADAARMNATRWALVGQLTEQAAGSPLRFAYRNLSYTDSEREPQVMLRAGAVQAGPRDLLPDECSSCLHYLREELGKNIPNDTAGFYLGYSCSSGTTSLVPWRSSRRLPKVSSPPGLRFFSMQSSTLHSLQLQVLNLMNF